MRKQVFNPFLSVTCSVLLLFCVGCAPLLLGAAAGAGGVAYVKGTLEKNYNSPVKDVHRASLAGLKSMGLIVTNDDITRHKAHIDAEFEDGQLVDIDIKALTERASRLRIRVGVLGNEARSEMILFAIEKHI